jgi:hypothetical protein
MATRTGLWIDHRNAIIVTVSDAGESTKRVESGVEKHVRYSGGARPGAGSREGAGEDHRERRFEGELHKYYDEVVAGIRDAEAIFIFGPGEAKGELKARLEHHGLGGRVVGVETADKMTDGQIAAKVRERLAQ